MNIHVSLERNPYLQSMLTSVMRTGHDCGLPSAHLTILQENILIGSADCKNTSCATLL